MMAFAAGATRSSSLWFFSSRFRLLFATWAIAKVYVELLSAATEPQKQKRFEVTPGGQV